MPNGNSNVFADSDDYVDWTWGTATNDLSVQDFCTTYNSQVQSHYDDWNGIDSDVFFLSYDWHIDMQNLNRDIRIYDYALTGTTYGTTAIYDKVLGILVHKNFWSFTGTVDMAKIVLDTRQDGLLSRTTADQNKTIVHEIGHALALDHPDCGSTAIMQQGYSSPAALTIQSHDETNLETKWD